MACHVCVAIKNDEKIIREIVRTVTSVRWTGKTLRWEGFVEQLVL